MVDQTSQFYAILTNAGAAKQANADALGIPWSITQMAVGDGNPSGAENPALPQPSATWTALLNEWRRAPLNQLKVDEKDASIIVAEQVIPADIGGRWIREIGLYDADGDLVAVANCAPTYKPLLSQGSGRTQVVRMNLIVSSSSNVQLKIDPSVVLATREWVEGELAKQDFKHSVLVATTAAITLTGLQTIDGVALTAGARVLVKNQAAAKDNGLYLVVAGGAWMRCTDADASAKVTPGMLVLVERGTQNADSAWQLLTDAPITLGVTALDFGMAFGRTGVAAGTYRSVQVDAYGRVVAASRPTTVEGYGLTDVYTQTQMDSALVLKAPLASPIFTGDPKAPTPPITDNDGSIATTEFVRKYTGQYGFAEAVVSTEANLDNYRTPGNWLTPAAGLLNLPSGWSAAVRYSLVVDGYQSNNSLVQTLTAGIQGGVEVDVAKRTLTTSNTWTAWRALTYADRLGSLAGAPVIVSADTVLTAKQVGLLFVTANGSQFTLPPLSEVPEGSCFYFLFNYGGASVKGNGSQVIQGGGAPANVYNAAYGERLTLVKRSNAWYVASGGIGLDGFLSLQGVNGWSKDPNGIIEQWGTAQISVPDGVSVAADVAFNIAFPNACWNFQASLGIYAASGSGYTTTRQGLNFGNPTKTGCWGRVFNDSGSASAASIRLLYWRARGY